MKTPLDNDTSVISEIVRHQWGLQVTELHFIPIGNSAYSYKLVMSQGDSYYLKIVDQSTPVGQRTAAHMSFSLPLQRLVATNHNATICAPCPQATSTGELSAIQGPYFCALYTFIAGETLADAYPMSPTLVQQIGQALATLHTIEIPETLRRISPPDSLTAAFDTALLADIAALATISPSDEPYLQRLRSIVWPQREWLRAFLMRSHEYERRYKKRGPLPTVVCHGDAWGGNLIQSPEGHFTLLDWEASNIAPAERDAFSYMGYIGPDFTAFESGYRSVQRDMRPWNMDLLAYYAYRLQLRNLAHWLHNVLHEPLNAVQRDNDITMIEHHCLDRLASVERIAGKLTADTKNS